MKIDVLKLKNVTEISKQIEEINKRYGLKITEQDIPLEENPKYDAETNLKIKKAWDLICSGDTLGIFQFASNVAIPVLKKMQPRTIEELAAATSFIRPGTSGLDEYVAGKKDSTSIKKLDPRLDRHLNKTYGAKILVPKCGNCWEVA